MQQTIVFALFGLFTAGLLVGGLAGLCLLMQRSARRSHPGRGPYAEPFGDAPGRRR